MNGIYWYVFFCILYFNVFDGYLVFFVMRVFGFKYSFIRFVFDDVNFFIVVVIFFFV